MKRSQPTLVIVGRVNRGKSSILSTLAELDSVEISPAPGTTREVHVFPLRVDGEVLFELVDTPGFEDAPRALRFLRDREESAAGRSEVVRSFVERFKGSGEFVQECKLLQPILAGGAIVYVVDGSHPYRSNYEAEMEILRWTGQPRIALINRTSARDHSVEWQAALGQFFSIVRVFDAHRAGFSERLRLFEGLREIDEGWRAAFDRAIAALESDWERRRRHAARTIAGTLVKAVLHVRSVTLDPADGIDQYRRKIEDRFHDDLRRFEEECRQEVEALYLHRALIRRENPISRPVLDEDLFSRKTWETFGLSLPRLVGLGSVAGAGTGGGFDALTGGAFLGGGMLVGGVFGGGWALYSGVSRFESAGDILRYLRGGRILTVGPHRNPGFPWILLDRALVHYVCVRDRAHGKRDPLQLDATDGERAGRSGIVATLPEHERRSLAKTISRLRSRKGERLRQELQQELADQIEPLLSSIQGTEPSGP